VEQEHDRGCRAAAQIDWRNGRHTSAESLLRDQCHLDDINGCIELAALLAERGRSTEAVRLAKRECTKSLGAEGLFPLMLAAQGTPPHACRLVKALESGRRPTRLNEIFQQPVDASEYVDPSDPAFGT
jgi:hypothetical protein